MDPLAGLDLRGGLRTEVSADLGIALNKISNGHHLRAVMVTATIFFVLSMKEAHRLEKAHPYRDDSFEKTCDWLAHSNATATGMAFIQEPVIRHLVFDRRIRPPQRSHDTGREKGNLRGAHRSPRAQEDRKIRRGARRDLHGGWLGAVFLRQSVLATHGWIEQLIRTCLIS